LHEPNGGAWGERGRHLTGGLKRTLTGSRDDQFWNRLGERFAPARSKQ
jgi:hypothetical protein